MKKTLRQAQDKEKMANDYHKSVLLNEVIDLLHVQPSKKYIDATLGGGGHAKTIIEQEGIVLGIDVDKDAIDYVQKNLKLQIANGKLVLVQGNFKDIDKIAHSQKFERVAGVIFDLGVSSNQIEKAERGFSFQKEGPLDMRMNQNEKLPTAMDFLNLEGKNELYEIFKEFGEEPRARHLASAIVGARKIKAFETTSDLLKVIEEVYGIQGPVSDKTRSDISKRVFQALRIAVNSELESLREGLPKALDLLEDKGRLAVISFHSLEDRIVKREFLDFENKGLGKVITDKPIIPKKKEQAGNRRARSAKLRGFSREAGSR